MASACLPVTLPGSPFPTSRVHVAPPSVLLNSPLPGPPLLRPQVWMTICHIPAYRMRGLPGCIARSQPRGARGRCRQEHPASGDVHSTRVQVAPPSVVRNTPRSSCGP